MKKLIFVSLLALGAAACGVNNADNPTNNTNKKDTDSVSGPDMPVAGDSGIIKPDASAVSEPADTTIK